MRQRPCGVSVRHVAALSERVSDSDREQAVLVLRDHLLDGRLTLEEFAERMELALRARTRGDLGRARSDLPSEVVKGVDSGRTPTRFAGALFGRVQQRGRLRLRGWVFAVSAFADVDLDLREAEIEKPRTVVTVMPVFGNVDVYVPEGVNVDVGGVMIVGRRREWGRDLASAGSPTIRVRVLGVFGTADVWRVPHGMRGSYAEILRQ